MGSYRPVVAATRVLDVLAAVNWFDGNATVGDIHRHTGLDKATIVRMLETLEHSGYILRNPGERAYRVTGKTLTLSSGYDRHTVMGAVVGPILETFRDDVGWPSDVGLFDNDAMLVIQTSRQSGPLMFNRIAGYRSPLLGASLGLAYIAHSPEEVRLEALKRLEDDPAPWNDIARDPDHGAAFFASIRERGYATMNEQYSASEYGAKVSAIGVPVMSGSEIYASMNVVYLKSAMTTDQAVTTLLGPLQETARKMGQALAQTAS